MRPAVAKAEHPASATSFLTGWVRQGVESFVAAQKILLGLVGQENALLVGMVRERMIKPLFRPAGAIAQFTDKGVETFTTAGKILLDLASGETALVLEGLDEGLRFHPAASTAAKVARHRVDTFISMQKNLLDATAEQVHMVAKSYQEGKGLMGGPSVAELARRGIESFVETEKKFLDLAAHEVSTGVKGHRNGKPARERAKVLTQLAREGVEKYIDAQAKLLDLAIEQLEFKFKPSSERSEAARKEIRTSWAELTEKSVRNFVTAQKSLMDLAVKKPSRGGAEKRPLSRARRRVRPVGEPKPAPHAAA